MGLAEDRFSIVVIPDTQILAANHPSCYVTMAEWIRSHAAELNVRMILHLGDVVHHGAEREEEFIAAQKAFDLLHEAGLPVMIAPGNHDYDNLVKQDRSLTMFNRYFGVHRYAGSPWFAGTFEDGHVENSYSVLDIGGEPYLFMALEFGARDEVLAWADSVLSAHSQHKAIIITHCYMYIHGERTKTGDAHNPKDYPGAVGANDGEDMWQKTFRKHGNLLAVFSGHHLGANVSWRIDRGDCGNRVFQSFQNWQSTENGGEGRLRIFSIFPSERKMRINVCNPCTNTFETGEGCEVELDLEY